MDLTPSQQIQILQQEIDNLEFGKNHYSRNRIYRDNLPHTIHMKKYDERISIKHEQIKKLQKSINQ